MPIKVQCGSCGAGFKAKDELAGRRVKCPKCAQPIVIGKPAPKPQAVGAGYNPLLDLLDEQQVKRVSHGPLCENCGADFPPGAVICVECGYNHETGQQLVTDADEDDSEYASHATMTDAERILAKAEKDIEDMPVAGDDQDFGDGSESYLIAIVAFVLGALAIGIGVTVVFSMEQLASVVSSAGISFVASILLYIAMAAWITIVAFKVNSVHGVVCIATGFLWCIVFGFMQGKTMILPTVIMLITLVMGAATGTYVGYNGWGPIAS